MTSHLPIELIQLIIDKLVEAPKSDLAQVQRDLRACSLVCRSFVALCQRHIFAQVQVGPAVNGGLARSRLATALQSNGSLAGFVKRIVYFPPRGPKPENTNAPSPHLSVLLRLPQVQHLEIVCIDTSPDFGRVIGEPYGASHFFKEYISSSSLTSLSIQAVTFVPLHIILSQPNLKRLRLVMCGILPTSSPAPAAPALRLLDLRNISSVSLACFQTGMHLDTLCLKSFEGFFSSPSLSALLPSLKKLRINALVNTDESTNNDTTTQNGILESATRLECLVVQAHILGRRIPLRIQECVSDTRAYLKRLHLYYTFKTTDMLYTAICDVLSAVQGQNIIEEVDIIVFFRRSLGFSAKFEGVVMPTLEVWSKLDELLDDDVVRFPCLRKVHIQIFVSEIRHDAAYNVGQGELDGVRNGVGRSFTRLLANPRIEFRAQVGTHKHAFYDFPETYMF